MTGDDALDRMIASLRALGTMPEEAAKLAVPYVDAAVKNTANAGTTPDGVPWAPKKDGSQALVHAADALSTKAVGAVVQVTLTGPTVFHNFAKGTSTPRRQVLPDGGAAIPKNIQAGLKKALDETFQRITGGK